MLATELYQLCCDIQALPGDWSTPGLRCLQDSSAEVLFNTIFVLELILRVRSTGIRRGALLNARSIGLVGTQPVKNPNIAAAAPHSNERRYVTFDMFSRCLCFLGRLGIRPIDANKRSSSEDAETPQNLGHLLFA